VASALFQVKDSVVEPPLPVTSPLKFHVEKEVLFTEAVKA